jgi:hypothetical protein
MMYFDVIMAAFCGFDAAHPQFSQPFQVFDVGDLSLCGELRD